MSKPYRVDVRFSDGTTAELSQITEEVMRPEGVVEFYSKTSEWAPREHVASYPLTALKSWRKFRDERGGEGF